jgi:tetratricopeptide (TPR) repeat protein
LIQGQGNISRGYRSPYYCLVLDEVLGKDKEYNKKQGLRCFKRKQWVKAISFLEKALREKKDPQVYLYLGYASLFTGDVDGARRYFKGGLLVKEDDPDILKGLAYVYLKDERLEDAIGLWGEVLDKRPGEKIVKRALEKLREAEDVKAFAEEAKLSDFLSPRLPLLIKLKPYLLGIYITVGIIVIGVLFYTTPLYRKALQRFYPEIIELDKIELPEGPKTDMDQAQVLYSLSEEDIEDSFIQVKRYIYKEKINAAIMLLNKVMLSNASPLVKEKFEILYTYIDQPDPLSIDYNPHFHEIIKEPGIYMGTYLLWKGRIANLKKEKESVQFDLLVNYEDQDTIEGIAHVEIEGVYFIENRQSIEVFGYYEGYDAETGKLLIRGILLRDLGLRDLGL